MSGVIIYCRSGFEGECAAEIQERAGELGVFGYIKTKASSGLVQFICKPEEADHLARKCPVRELIFPRQLWVKVAELNELPVADRVSPMVAAWQAEPAAPRCGRLWVETADTNEGRALSGLARKITPPLSKALREHNLLLAQDTDRQPVAHVLFRSTHSALMGYSYTFSHQPWPSGVPRIKSPRRAPSRSAAKLAEAIKMMVPADELPKRLQTGMKAVDLGASPGGWTAVLVQHGLMVQAIDNGPMAEELIATGQVEHIQADGFVFRPKRRNVEWVVCDMVEKPVRVAHLMVDWLTGGWCNNAIFNLKLPMKKRYAAVQQYLAAIEERLATSGTGQYEMTARHLYHDREEITVYLRRSLR